MSARMMVGLAVALTGGFLTAQLKQGDKPPELEFVKAWNDGPQRFADLAGKVVLLDFAQSVHPNCIQGITYLNELHTKYGKRGLLVLGVSDEPEATIEAQFVRGGRSTYPWVKANDFKQKYAIRFWPSTYLLDANGLVYSWADLGPPDEAMIEELLQQLPLPPAMPADAVYDPFRAMWTKAEYASIDDGVGKLLAGAAVPDDMRQVLEQQRAALAARQAAQLARVEQLAAGPDYAAATLELERMVKAWATMPPAIAAQKELDRFAADATIKKEVSAGRALQKMMTHVDTSKLPALRKLITDLDKFRKKNAELYAGKQALAQYTRLCARPKPE